MKIKTLTIRPDGDDFAVTISPPSEDKYVKGPRFTSAMGNYHFDCDKYSDNEAKVDLINYMVARHDEEISRLQKSRDVLLKLKELCSGGCNAKGLR